MKTPRFDLESSIIFQNEDYILINKPPFISTLEDRNDPYNLLQLVKGIESNSQVGHRLDKNTSGVLAVARNPEAYKHISLQFQQRQVQKIYHAVVDGIHSFEEKVVRDRILKLSDGTVRIDPKGKDAETTFSTLQSFMLHSLIQCTPITGRMHQIRIHLSSLGAPISGDDAYGGKPIYLSKFKRGFNLKKQTEEEPIMKRMALHANFLGFLGLNGEKIEASAPYPKDFSALLNQLGRNLR